LAVYWLVVLIVFGALGAVLEPMVGRIIEGIGRRRREDRG
jgi:hypothetical protein